MLQLHWKRRLPPTLESKDSGINFHGLSSNTVRGLNVNV